MAVAASDYDVSLGEGGPLRRFESVSHLTKWPAQLVVAILLTWVPIMVLGIISELRTDQPMPLVHDVAMHVRLLVGVPMLLFLDRTFSAICRFTLLEIVGNGVIPAAELPRFDVTLRRVRRLGDLWVPELVLALIALVFGLAVPRGFGAAQIWYAVVGVPLFEFLLLRSLWRWFLWLTVLIGLSRLELDLEATHPDHRGGLSRLHAPSLNYCAMLLFATSAVLCAEWGGRFSAENVISYVPLLLAFAAFATLVAFGPLALFIPQLVRARRNGLCSMGIATARAGRWTRTRWSVQGAEEALQSAEIQAFEAMVATYRETVARMSLLLVTKTDVITLLVATLAPVLVLMFATIPTAEWLSILRLLTPGF